MRILLFLFLLANFSCFGQTIQLAVELRKGYNDVYEALETFKKVDAFVDQVNSYAKNSDGEKPDFVNKDRWENLLAKLKNDEKQIENAPQVADFDDRPFRVNHSDLANPNKRNESFNKLDNYANALDGQERFARSQESELADKINQLEIINQSLGVLAETYRDDAKFMGISSEVSTMFYANYLDIDRDIQPTLRGIIKLMNDQKTKLHNEILKMDQKYRNLITNENSLKSALKGNAPTHAMNGLQHSIESVTYSYQNDPVHCHGGKAKWRKEHTKYEQYDHGKLVKTWYYDADFFVECQ